MAPQFDDIPSVRIPPVGDGIPTAGDLLCDAPDDEFRRRLKYLLLTLAQNEASITLAKCYGLEFAEEGGVLKAAGDDVTARQFNLACYADSELRPFYDALGIIVHEEE